MLFFRVFVANLYFCQVRTTAAAQERIILGIDPGTNVLGYGLLSVCGKKAEMIAMGVIDLRRVSDVYLKLGRIYERIMGVIDAFHPDELAIEAPFFGKNVQSMLKLGRAQGVVIAAAIARQIPIHEYAPMQIKQAITGRGAASKEQVAALMQRLLNIADDRMLPYLDATDALAAANGEQPVDGAHARIQRLTDRLAVHRVDGSAVNGAAFTLRSGPKRSIGRPSASTTRPRRPCPIGR